MNSLNAFNSSYGYSLLPNKELAKLPKANQMQAKQVARTLNFLKIASYLPVISTIVYAIALAKVKKSDMEKNEYSAHVSRAVISLIPGLGLALLPVDLFATAITHPIMHQAAKKKQQQAELQPKSASACSSKTLNNGDIHSESCSKTSQDKIHFESVQQGFDPNQNTRLLLKLIAQADTVKLNDGSTAYNYKKEESAQKLSECLKNIGILGSTGKPKWVARHVENNPHFGVLLTYDNLCVINLIKNINKNNFKELDQKQAHHLSEELEQALKKVTFPVGYYRNSIHSLNNLVKALKKFAETGDLDAQFEATSSYAQGGTVQPDNIRKTLERATSAEVHGGIIQTINAIYKYKDKVLNRETHHKVAEAAQKIVNILRACA